MAAKLKIKLNSNPAIKITRTAIQAEKLVYIARSNKRFPYRNGKSHIVYIGTTKIGVRRIAASAARKAEKTLSKFGVKHLDFYVITCKRRKNVQTWRFLERALLLTFRERFGDVPYCNNQGMKIQWNCEREYFRDDQLREVINHFS